MHPPVPTVSHIAIVPAKRIFSGKSEAFTLVELLSTIGIIALLSTLLLTGITSMKTSAERTKCASNLRQIGVAIQLYAADHNQTLPGPTWGGQDPFYWKNDQNMLAYLLQPYLSYPDPTSRKQMALLFVCPSFARINNNSSGRSYLTNLFAKKADGTSFAPFGYPGGNPPPATPSNALAVDNPAMTWLIQDNDSTISGKAIYSHGKYRNRLFADGHVAVSLVNPASPSL
jgi:prepilin-type processing-associated H-X9-DG protein